MAVPVGRPTGLAPHDRALALALARAASGFIARAHALIAGKVEDAHGHATRALTKSLRRTPDGRRSLLALNLSPQFAAAARRLDELLAGLAGPSERSLEGVLRDAREGLYAEAMAHGWGLVPEPFRARRKPVPTRAEAALIRAAAPFGYDLRKEWSGPVEAAKLSMKAALEQAARRSTPDHVADELLDAWASSTSASLARKATSSVGDSAVLADVEANRALIDPVFLD